MGRKFKISLGKESWEMQLFCSEMCSHNIIIILHHINANLSLFFTVPDNYKISLNATQYYIQLTSETPLNSVVLSIQLYINLYLIPVASIMDLSIRLNQNQLVQSLLEFQDGKNDRYEVDKNNITNNDGTGVITSAIKLVELPQEDDYPVTLDLFLTVTILYNNFFSSYSTSAMATGSITLPQSKELNG